EIHMVGIRIDGGGVEIERSRAEIHAHEGAVLDLGLDIARIGVKAEIVTSGEVPQLKGADLPQQVTKAYPGVRIGLGSVGIVEQLRKLKDEVVPGAVQRGDVVHLR